MSAPPPASTDPRRLTWSLALPAVIALAYALGHLAWYLGTPLGQTPVLDERENLALAEAIVHGTLPPEPFYRAPGYALVLASLRALGVGHSALFPVALVLGALLHAVNAHLVARIARTWFDSRAALIAGVLYALHPVCIHYATQALDATPALALFLAGLSALAPTFVAPAGSPHPPWRWAVASVCWAAATLMRPNYLLPWCVLPLLAFAPWTGIWRVRCAVASLAGATLFGGIALWQAHVCGQPGFLPWQGAYNLWAANEPGAHGRYYVQKHSLPAAVAEQNPARAESVYLFQRETGALPTDISALNAHWRGRFLDRVMHDPLGWTAQLVRKTYALLNDWEQYNNKTFAFHRARSPWLRWNPLCWGFFLTAGVAGFARLSATVPRGATAVAAVALACTASILLFFVSARFRLPLVAIAAVLTGGALANPRFWRDWPRRHQLTLAAAVTVAAALAFSTFDRVRDRATFVQDHALLARAALTVGDDATAWHEALGALALQPSHPDALRIAIAAYFNELMSDRARPADEPTWLARCTTLLASPDRDAPDLRAVAALALWRNDQRAAALGAWRELAGAPSALAARLLVGDVAPAQVDTRSWPTSAWREPLVRLAAVEENLPLPVALGPDEAARAPAVARRLFGVSAHTAPP